jgi:prolyl-tRNA synthetase
MRLSRLLLPTLRDNPAEAEVPSHRLMMRAGMIRKLSSGLYTYLPMGLRVLTKIETIVREEMTRIGAQEVLMPVLQPAELWQETGRWQAYGKELMRLQDRHDRSFCLGPTHEEVITDLVRREVQSYRQLPLILYQIQTKFRDEIRPRFGLMRGREFIMKDAYSFDADLEGAKVSYQNTYDAYQRIFQRAGLRFRAVEADTGLIGGSASHEFMVLAQTGEEAIASCTACDYAANVEQAEAAPPQDPAVQADTTAMEKVVTPGQTSVAEVSAYLNVAPRQLIKTLIFMADGRAVAVLIRGDHELNEIKLKRLLGVSELSLADAETVARTTGGPSGFSGPVGLSGIPILADTVVFSMRDGVIGANEKDAHYVHARPGRDFQVERVADLRNVVAGDGCPRCGAPIALDRGIEVGHVFMLGTKYSVAMKATYLDPQRREQPFVMGCYGIGVSRVMAAAIEQNHDERGMIWPLSIAPFPVEIIPVQEKSASVMKAAESFYADLSPDSALLDDRDERPGVKFNDADLLGIPYQLIIGQKNLDAGHVEIKVRRTGERHNIAPDQVIPYLTERFREASSE